MRALLLVLLLSGCGASGLAIANGAALGVSTAALACDWGQTRSFAEIGWQTTDPGARAMRFQEVNPIMGSTPSTGTVDLYFLSALALNLAAWVAIPRRWRMAIPIVITVIQSRAIYNTVANAGHSDGLCITGGAPTR